MTSKTRILLGVTGGIAAYKSPDLVRRLIERGADVQVVMTAAAQRFVTPMSFQAVSGHPTRSDLWDTSAEAAMGHIELARWAQLVLIAPASADFIARLAGGQYVLGQPLNRANRRKADRLRTVSELYPEIVDAAAVAG